MPENELRQALEAHQKNLDNLRYQAAQHGIDIPVELQNAIDHEKTQIATIQQELDDRNQPATDELEERIATLYGEIATLSLEAAGYGSKVPPKLEMTMAGKRAEIARLRRMLRPSGRNEYQDMDARMDMLEHEMREVQSIVGLILGRINPTLRNRLLGVIAGVFLFVAVAQWLVFEVRGYYMRDATSLALGLMVTILGIVVSTLFYIVRRYVAI